MSSSANSDNTMRINRFLARAGLGSRRAVEEIIVAGKVAVNGEVISDLGRRIDPQEDSVTVDGRPVFVPEDFRIYIFHKPEDVVSTLKSQGGQASLLPYRMQADLPDRFVPVGRLDAETTGLLLWTDDGELNQNLCRPSSGVWKKYEVLFEQLHYLPKKPHNNNLKIFAKNNKVSFFRLFNNNRSEKLAIFSYLYSCWKTISSSFPATPHLY